MKKLFPLFHILILFNLLSCSNKTQQENRIAIAVDDAIEVEIKPQATENSYPKTGKKAVDFLPKSNIYNIQYEAKGDLNKDGLADIAVVLVHKKVNTAQRPLLILLQNKDKSYRLDKVSNVAMQIEYSENEFKRYETEQISIEKGILKIHLFGIGPSGNLFSDFKYIGNNLILNYIETYNTGAGSWQQLYYDLEKGQLTQLITDTMEEEMPTQEKMIKLPKVDYLFENADPEAIMNEIYKKIEDE